MARLTGRGARDRQKEEFWALRRVTFDVAEGEVLGVIGRNGAGKSTLLKILSRITSPTEGQATVRGRVGSLLEVGAGFHPELTGRENVNLNAAIHGMRRSELMRKFDEIVQFAEVEDFLDMPVKRYSSGMFVRLAFAVAAHLEPEVLIVDEVLSVGDIQFQKKCLAKMSDVASDQGRTVIFVSHAMDAVRQLCHRSILLVGGEVAAIGPTSEVIAEYLRSSDGSQGGTRSVWTRQERERFDCPELLAERLAVHDERGREIAGMIGTSQRLFVTIQGSIERLWPNFIVGISLYREGTLLFDATPWDAAEAEWPAMRIGRFTLTTELPISLLNEGAYRVELISALHHGGWIIPPGTGPTVEFDLVNDSSRSPYVGFKRRGMLVPELAWHLAA